jgi:hypothetical protein
MEARSVNQGSRYRRIAFPRNTSSSAIPASEMLNSPSATVRRGALPMELRHPCAAAAVQELGDRGQTG